MTRHPNPPPLPEGAIFFVASRPDRDTHMALYHPDGTLSLTFGQNEDPDRILADAGFVTIEIAGRRDHAFAVLRRAPAPPATTCIEHAYGSTTRLSFQIKVF